MNGRRQEPRGRSAADERFVRDVLARTSGPACTRALERLPDLTDDKLAGLDRKLVQEHLEHCPPCRAVAVVLGWLPEALPTLARIDPGEEFTRAVLARTSGLAREQAQRRRLTGAAGLMDRLGRWWEARLQQPIFAAQAAFAATVVLVLLTSVPYAPLRGLPHQALALVQAGPTSLPLVDRAVESTSSWVETRAEAVAGTWRDGASSRWTRITEDIDRRLERTAGDRLQIKERWRALAAAAGKGRLGQVGYEIMAAGKEFGSFWRHWWREEHATDGS